METVAEASSSLGPVYVVMMFLGYAIIFSYILLAIAKKDLRYSISYNKDDLKRLEKRTEEKFERIEKKCEKLQSDNNELRRELRKFENKN